jgi:hypothetical protein
VSDSIVSSGVAPTGVAAGRPRAWPPLALALGGAAAYAVFLVLPYFVNGLYRLPLDEVASGAHDPKDLWPNNTWLAFVFGLGQLGLLTCGPFVAMGAPVWAMFLLWRDRSRHGMRARVTLLLAVPVGFGSLAWLGTPFGSALIAWWLD